MHLAMGVPLRVATATSNLMIGITAAASAVIYLIRGGIDPYVAGPTAIGVFIGATRRLAARRTASTCATFALLFVVGPALHRDRRCCCGRSGERHVPDARAAARARALAAERLIGRLLIAVTYVVGRTAGRSASS